ncbi:hypothetical protein [Mesorhizobium sp. M7A.F.Ca.US.014.04.1.1]|uniref:hypothetical protein n=1 Tax=Mesorhizobium sp. M7A.F.Ca.US.014.04.1.1 TaxID=2496744 RepID=UPI000FD37D9B|nr:hypothetical protein [Mesorhizobium sp. M7A.F.Ca.US.014.04.1.1]RUZ12382.1 hypothetical protein EN958_12135 [Mesorhizobium sp. M7A.F.Ca.CA.002.15.1.1]
MPKKQASILQHTHAKRRRLWSNPFQKPIGPAESSKWAAESGNCNYRIADLGWLSAQNAKTGQ